MKVKSTMEDKIFDFAKTKDALSELSTTLIELEEQLKIKQNEIVKNKKEVCSLIEDKEQKLQNMANVAKDALKKIDDINQYIAEIL